MQIGKGGVTLSQFPGYMILYRERTLRNPHSHTQKKGFLEVINEFSKVSGHKIKIQKSIVVLHTINEKLKTDI